MASRQVLSNTTLSNEGAISGAARRREGRSWIFQGQRQKLVVQSPTQQEGPGNNFRLSKEARRQKLVIRGGSLLPPGSGPRGGGAAAGIRVRETAAHDVRRASDGAARPLSGLARAGDRSRRRLWAR